MSNVIIKRPKDIFELFSSLGNLSGVGEKKLNLLEKKIGPYLINLLFYLPHKSINRFQNISLINVIQLFLVLKLKKEHYIKIQILELEKVAI